MFLSQSCFKLHFMLNVVFHIISFSLISPQPPESQWSTVPGNVKHLSDDTLIDFLKSHKSVLVMFYSPRK